MRKMRTFVAAAVLASAPAVVQAETCSMYQKYKKDQAGTLCADQGSRFREVGAAPSLSGTFYARPVPKCDANGTDTGCPEAQYVRSLDGTRAYYHVDPVPDSNQWVFFFEGGGSCGAMRGLNAAAACYTNDPVLMGFNGYSYVPPVGTVNADPWEMTSEHAEGNYTVPNRRVGRGILSTSASNPFSSYNRVWIDKTTFDRFMGNMTNTQVHDGDDIELYFHGRAIIKSVIKDLDRSNGVICVGGQEGEEVCSGEEAPDLSDAASVLFVGESGGAGGLIHNAQWLKNRIAVVSTSIKVNFAPASRMLPWIQAEAFFGGTGTMWSAVQPGSSEVDKNPAGGGPATVDITYSPATFEAGGEIRELLGSWGDPASFGALYLDASCKLAHGIAAWHCFDEGHVALYHTDENMFFFQSLLDSVHSGPGSPAFWIETVDLGGGPILLDPGFVWDPPGPTPPADHTYVQDRAARVLYAIDSILLDTSHRGARGFYAPGPSAHTQVMGSGFWSATLDCPLGGHTWSFADALLEWETQNNSGLCAAPGCDFAAVEDTFATYPITFWNGTHNGGGWIP
jgi:hypothetical protein